MRLRDIEARLVEIIQRYFGLAIPDDQLRDMIELARAGEPGVAPENFCTQLYEYDIHLPPGDLAALRGFAESMGIADKSWTSSPSTRALRDEVVVTVDVSPFVFIEHDDGDLSLLLKAFGPTVELLDETGSPGPGHGWETIARYVVEHVLTELEDRVDFNSEHSTFCAFGTDRAALEALGARLARLFHDEKALAEIIEAIGPGGFDPL